MRVSRVHALLFKSRRDATTSQPCGVPWSLTLSDGLVERLLLGRQASLSTQPGPDRNVRIYRRRPF